MSQLSQLYYPHFFHRSAVQDGSFASLRDGDRVTFTPTTGAKGPRAEDVRLEE